MTVAAASTIKRYRGASAEERRAQRREQLILAAVAVYGERGFHGATVKAVCEAASLTERYFYESFANSEALLLATFRAVTRVLEAELREAGEAVRSPGAARVEAMIRAYFEALRRDPRSARVFLVEIRGVSPEVDRELDAALPRFAGLLKAAWGRPAGAADPLLKAGVAGAMVNIAINWIAGDYRIPLDTVVAAAARIAAVLAEPAGAS